MDELIEFPLVDASQPIEARTADDFLLESFAEVGALLVPDQHVDLVDCAEGEQEFFKHDLAHEASRARHQHPLSCVFGHYRHCYIVRLIDLNKSGKFRVSGGGGRKGRKERECGLLEGLGFGFEGTKKVVA